jgi:hypothetical protein
VTYLERVTKFLGPAKPRDERDDPPWNPAIHLRSLDRWSVLATYNSERARGIVHTAEWDALMAEEQEKWAVWHRGSA